MWESLMVQWPCMRARHRIQTLHAEAMQLADTVVPVACVIFVHDSCFSQPHLFRMDKSTGSPPDFFDPNGQNWGFPTYNWEAMAEEGYVW